MLTIDVGRLATMLAQVGVESVAQDGEKPRLKVRALFIRLQFVPRLDQRLLDEVVSAVDIARERESERPQVRYRLHKLGLCSLGRCG